MMGGRDPIQICRVCGVSKVTIYNWRKKYNGIYTCHLKELKAMKEENRRLKQIYADLMLDHNLARAI
jgi:putative transposase